MKKFHGDNSAVDTEYAVLALHNSISITKEIRDDGLKGFEWPVYLKMEGTKPEAMSEFLTALVETAKQDVIEETLSSISSALNSEVSKLTARIRSLHLTEKAKRAERILLFSEALDIAKRLGIKNNSFNKLNNDKRQLSLAVGGRNDTRTAAQNNSLPMWFLYGENALQQELLRLKLRKNGTMPESVKYKVELERLKAINLSPQKINVAIISLPGIPPASPIKPKVPIIAIGMLLGLVLGVVVSFLRNAMAELREKQKSSTPDHACNEK